MNSILIYSWPNTRRCFFDIIIVGNSGAAQLCHRNIFTHGEWYIQPTNSLIQLRQVKFLIQCPTLCTFYEEKLANGCVKRRQAGKMIG